MAERSDKFRHWWEERKKQLRHTYRLIIMNNETFEEVGSYRLTLLNVYIAASTVLVLVALLVVLAIAFTPLRRYVPGYGDSSDRRQVEMLYREVKDLEAQLVAQREHSTNIQRLLVGDVLPEEEEEAEEEMAAPAADSLTKVELSEEEEQLRQEMELREVGATAQQGRRTNFSPGSVPLEQMFFSPPLKGEISFGFKPDDKHYGVDILAPKNTAIKAAMDGFIFFADWTMETGNTIGIQHANNTITFYKHNSAILKKSGSYVKAGEAVAIIGNTGTKTDGPHLHFELWHRGKPVDPAEYIKF